jgi:peptidoglycan/LPS O-acetylase OafA/YrhL
MGGAFSIVAFHIEIPFSGVGWIAVELFFVIAGINMAAACNREQSIAAYAWSRARRLFPELCAVWCSSALLVLLGFGTVGMLWFVGSAPFFLQNVTLPFFDYSMPRDYVFGPLWFVGALLQLQVLLFASKRLWLRAKPASVIAACFCFGLSSRLLFALFLGDSARTLPNSYANVLYCLPIAHVESIVLGVMMGRGAWSGLGRWLPVFGALALVLGTWNAWWSQDLAEPRTLGFGFPLRLHYIHIWGYSILALCAASLCAKRGAMAGALERIRHLPWLEKRLAQLAPLTYGVYAFHGLTMATGINGWRWLSRDHAPALRLLLFAITLAESFLLAWGFAWCTQVAMPWLLKAYLKKRRDFGEDFWATNSRRTNPITPLALAPELLQRRSEAIGSTRELVEMENNQLSSRESGGSPNGGSPPR